METSIATDEQLILEFQKGSREAFSELFLRYRELIYAFFRRRVKDAARAEELAQETFMVILRAAQRYEPRAAFRTYLFGVAYKILANDRRKLDQNSDGAGLGLDLPSPSAPGNAEASEHGAVAAFPRAPGVEGTSRKCSSKISEARKCAQLIHLTRKK